MKLKLDENISRHLKPVLIGLGHDVLTAANEDFFHTLIPRSREQLKMNNACS
jgi:hypothetical protein